MSQILLNQQGNQANPTITRQVFILFFSLFFLTSFSSVILCFLALAVASHIFFCKLLPTLCCLTDLLSFNRIHLENLTGPSFVRRKYACGYRPHRTTAHRGDSRLKTDLSDNMSCFLTFFLCPLAVFQLPGDQFRHPNSESRHINLDVQRRHFLRKFSV